jgi:hypothetical protein
VRRISPYLPLLFVLACYVPMASAQSSFDINVGFGAIQDSAAKTGLDQNLNSCALNSTGCTKTPSLNSFVIGVGGDLMLWKKFGVGAEMSIQPAKQTYVDLTSSAASAGLSTLSLDSRVTLYDFNGILEPVNTKKVAVKLSGGIGGANIKFYESGSSSNSLIGSQNFSQYFGSSNHFQVHGGLGVQIYLTDHVYVRPQIDVHYVHNLSQFGRNAITEEMVWLGYSWGDRP